MEPNRFFSSLRPFFFSCSARGGQITLVCVRLYRLSLPANSSALCKNDFRSRSLTRGSFFSFLFLLALIKSERERKKKFVYYQGVVFFPSSSLSTRCYLFILLNPKCIVQINGRSLFIYNSNPNRLLVLCINFCLTVFVVFL